MPRQPRHPGNTIIITVTVVLVSIIALLLIAQPFTTADVLAQNDSQATGDVLSFPVQIYPGAEAIALINKQHQTICLYQYRPDAQPHERFALLASRSYRYDCQLEDFNNASPTPADIKHMIEQVIDSGQPEPAMEDNKPQEGLNRLIEDAK